MHACSTLPAHTAGAPSASRRAGRPERRTEREVSMTSQCGVASTVPNFGQMPTDVTPIQYLMATVRGWHFRKLGQQQEPLWWHTGALYGSQSVDQSSCRAPTSHVHAALQPRTGVVPRTMLDRPQQYDSHRHFDKTPQSDTQPPIGTRRRRGVPLA
jgi:hypothetical protein